MNRRTVPDPSWKSGPPEPEHRHEEHDLRPAEDTEFDGFGRDEVDTVEGEPLIVVNDYCYCARDGCERHFSKRRLFTTDTLSTEEEQKLNEASPYGVAEYVWSNAVQIDVETIAVPVENDETVTITQERVVKSGDWGTACFGRTRRGY